MKLLDLKKTTLGLRAMTMLVLFVSLGSATAAVVETDKGYAFWETPTVSTTSDLIYGATPTEALGNLTATGGSLSVLTDGLFGSYGDTTTSFGGGNGAATSVTYSLGSSVTGYDVTEILTLSGWSDAGRFQQGYTVSYSLVSDPTTFLSLYTVSAFPTDPNNAGFGVLMAGVDLTSDTSALATNVASVQITFNNVANGWSGYHELAIYGMASVPEPQSWLLMIGSICMLPLMRKMRREPLY